MINASAGLPTTFFCCISKAFCLLYEYRLLLCHKVALLRQHVCMMLRCTSARSAAFQRRRLQHKPMCALPPAHFAGVRDAHARRGAAATAACPAGEQPALERGQQEQVQAQGAATAGNGRVVQSAGRTCATRPPSLLLSHACLCNALC